MDFGSNLARLVEDDISERNHRHRAYVHLVTDNFNKISASTKTWAKSLRETLLARQESFETRLKSTEDAMADPFGPFSLYHPDIAGPNASAVTSTSPSDPNVRSKFHYVYKRVCQNKMILGQHIESLKRHRKEIDNTKDRIKANEATVVDLKADVSKMAEDFTKEKNAATSRHDTLREDPTSGETAIDSLKREMQQRAGIDAVTALEQRISQLEQNSERLEDDNKRFEKENGQLDHEVKQSEYEKQQLEDCNTKLSQRLTILNKGIAEYQSDIEQQIKAMARDQTTAMTAMQQRLTTAEEANAILKTSVQEELRSTSTNLQSRIDKIPALPESMEQRLTAVEKTTRLLASSSATFEEVSVLREEFDTYKTAADDLGSGLRVVERNVEKISEETTPLSNLQTILETKIQSCITIEDAQRSFVKNEQITEMNLTSKNDLQTLETKLVNHLNGGIQFCLIRSEQAKSALLMTATALDDFTHKQIHITNAHLQQHLGPNANINMLSHGAAMPTPDSSLVTGVKIIFNQPPTQLELRQQHQQLQQQQRQERQHDFPPQSHQHHQFSIEAPPPQQTSRRASAAQTSEQSQQNLPPTPHNIPPRQNPSFVVEELSPTGQNPHIPSQTEAHTLESQRQPQLSHYHHHGQTQTQTQQPNQNSVSHYHPSDPMPNRRPPPQPQQTITHGQVPAQQHVHPSQQTAPSQRLSAIQGLRQFRQSSTKAADSRQSAAHGGLAGFYTPQGFARGP
ncbi:hypothetical protein NX059_008424 [Plenodomus lindquistii]|nr:hypothetical protein NX059_008424 [Plenodomus lindquistii]